ncbi:MAG: class I SAM-dependent methyltransferase [Clostridiales bacterium]|nr:class I SAM-dependent methyltransferase [Clostridiales bacterium]
MDSKERFTTRAEDYAKYRPEYPEQVIDYFIRRTGITQNSIIVDIGSGTGKFSGMLCAREYNVIGVEPNKAMREQAEIMLRRPRFTSVCGSAEETTLPDNSADAIVSAQAFHWFNLEKCKPEFRRILKTGAKVAVIWNNRDSDTIGNFNKKSSEFMKQLHRVLSFYPGDLAMPSNNRTTSESFADFFESGFDSKEFSWNKEMDYQGVWGLIRSHSNTPLEGNENYLPLKKAVKDLFDKCQTNGTVTIFYSTDVFIGSF